MRTLTITKPPEHGPDVEEMQRLLGVTVDGVWGIQSGTAAYREKVKLGYLKPDHSAGPLLVAYMTGKRKPTAAMVKRAHMAPKLGPGTSGAPPAKLTTEQIVRGRIPGIWNLLVANAARVHYPPGDRRTTSRIHEIATLAQLEAVLNGPDGFQGDCSQTVSCVIHVAGAKCPDGEYAANWAADGYTGTLLKGSPEIPASQVQVGDFYVYGGGTGHHTAQCVQRLPNDFLMGSHGSDPVHLILHTVELGYQPAGGSWRRLQI